MKISRSSRNLLSQKWVRLFMGITTIIAIGFVFKIPDRIFRGDYRKFPWEIKENATWELDETDVIQDHGNGPAITTENAANVIQLARIGNGIPKGSVWSPDGKYLLITSSIGITVYDGLTFDKLHFLKSDSNIFSIIFSPVDTILAVGTFDGKIQLWRLTDGGLQRIIVTENPFNSPMMVLAFSNDGKYLLASLNNIWHIWRIEDGKHLVEFYPGVDQISTLVFSSETGIIIGLLHSQERIILDNDTKEPTPELESAPDAGAVVDLTLNQKYVIWDLNTSEELERFNVNDKDLDEIITSHIKGYPTIFQVPEREDVKADKSRDQQKKQAVSEDRHLLIRDAGARHIQVLNNSDGHTTKEPIIFNELDIFNKRVKSLSISPDNSTVGIIFSDSTIDLWRLSSGQVNPIKDYESIFTCSEFPPEERRPIDGNSESYDADLTPGSVGGNVKFQSEVERILISNYAIAGRSSSFGRGDRILFSHDGKLLASTNSLGIWTWRVPGTALESCIPNLSGTIIPGNVFSPDGRVVLQSYEKGRASSSDKEVYAVRMWRISNWKLIREYKTNSKIMSLAISKDGERVAAGERDNRIKVWTNGSPKILETTSMPISLAFSPDGSLLAVGLNHDPIQIWSMATIELVSQIKLGLDFSASSLAFSPDGSILAAGDLYGQVVLLQVSDGGLLQTLEGHTGYISSLVFSPLGNLLASISSDGTIRLWGTPGTP